MTAEVKGMFRVEECLDIKKLTQEKHKELIKSRPVRWNGRTVAPWRRHSVHVLLRDNPFAKIEKANEK